MKYTPATFAKAIVAFIVSASGAIATSGVDINHLTTGTVLGALGVGLTAAAAVFVTPNKPNTTASSPADQVIQNIPVVVQEVADKIDALNKVKQAADEAFKDAPVIVGSLAKQVIDSVRLR